MEDLLWTGYFRSAMQNLNKGGLFSVIPPEVQDLCIAYGLDEEAFEQRQCFQFQHFLEFEQALHLNQCYSLLPLQKVVRTGIHCWRFQVLDSKRGWQMIGIIPASIFVTSIDADGYGFIYNQGRLSNPELYGEHGRYYGTQAETKDIITMILDLMQLTLSFKINDKHYGIAFEINPGAYSAAAQLCNVGSGIRFLSHETVHP